MKTLNLIILLSLSGCALSSASFEKISENKYEITAGGNAWDNEETLLKTINKKALKVCGSENYKIIGESPIVLDSLDTGYTVAPIQILTRTVLCGEN